MPPPLIPPLATVGTSVAASGTGVVSVVQAALAVVAAGMVG